VKLQSRARNGSVDNVVAQRRWYAEELRWAAALRSERLVEAFAAVPRERFLGRGPWQISTWRGYCETPNANPQHIHHNVLVAIDAQRDLNNGRPAFLAALIEQLKLREGGTVCHVGCGTGYYSAIMAEVVGSSGHVIAIEVDKDLARRSKTHLRSYKQVEVVNADGFAYDPGRVDALLVNAGVSHLSPIWLRVVRAKGRMVVPMTLANGEGQILTVVRTGRDWQARFVYGVRVFPCSDGRDQRAEMLLKKALKCGGASEVRSLRLERHRRSHECWLHGDGFCLSRLPWQAASGAHAAT